MNIVSILDPFLLYIIRTLFFVLGGAVRDEWRLFYFSPVS